MYHSRQTRKNALPAPTTFLGFILATLYGATFHLVMGGDVRRLALFLLSGWVGFGLGHIFGTIFEINLLNIGTLRIVTATFGALIALAVAHVLTAKRTTKRRAR